MDQIGNGRRSIRLPGYDYSQPGAYFITICTHRRALLFGRIKETEILLHRAGAIVAKCWQEIPQHFPSVSLDQWIVMPNHLHGILVISDEPTGVGARHASPLPQVAAISTVIGSFKSAAAKHVNAARRTPGAPVWQRNYYEHVVRNERALDRIRNYIAANPFEWSEDPENPSSSSFQTRRRF